MTLFYPPQSEWEIVTGAVEDDEFPPYILVKSVDGRIVRYKYERQIYGIMKKHRRETGGKGN